MKNISNKTEKLVNDKVEGVITREDLMALETIISSSEDARSYLESMEALHRSLETAGKQKQGIDVSKEVMEHIRHLHEAQHQTTKTISFSSYFTAYNKQLMRYAAVLVVGLLLGTAISYTLVNWRADISGEHARATLSSRQGQAMEASGGLWQLFTQPMVVGEMAMLVVSLQTQGNASVTISYDPDAFRLENTRFLNEESTARVSASRGEISFTTDGDVVFQVVYKRTPGTNMPLLLTLEQNGNFVHQREISF